MESKRSQKILHGACALGASVAISGAVLPFAAYPIGFALLCAGGAWTPIIFAGLCIGTLTFQKSALFLLAYTLVLVLRAGISLVGRHRLTFGDLGTYIFCEHVSLRAVEAAAACLAVGLYRLWRGGFLYYDLIGMAISMMSAAMLVIVWSLLGKKSPKAGFWYDAALLSLSAAVVWSLRGVGGYGFEFSVLVCSFLTLASTKKFGVIFGCFEGLVCGLCISLSYAPMFVFASVFFAFFGTLSALLGSIFALGASLAWGYYISGLPSIVALSPSLLAGNLIYYIFQKIYPSDTKNNTEGVQNENIEDNTHTRLENTDERFSVLRLGLKRFTDKYGTAAVDMRDMSDYMDKLYRAPQAIQAPQILELSIAKRSRNAVGEKDYCGDSLGFFRSDNCCRTVAFISDGMGSGKRAARASGLCKAFVENLFLLSVKSDDFFESAIQLLNNFLRIENGQDECSCTLDLGEFDLCENKATFYKCGSAPTYVFRDGGIFKLRAETVPLGIFSEADIGKTQMDILPGDVFVMMSDGASDIGEENGKLASALSRKILTHNAEQLAEALIDYSNSCGFTDDVSTVVIKVSEKNIFEQSSDIKAS